MDVIKEVIELIKVKERHYKKQWWPHLARWARWDGEAGSKEWFHCFKAF
jgi:hypothetical protein